MRLFLLLAGAAISLAACNNSEHHEETEEPTEHNSGEIVISKDKAKQIGLVTETPRKGGFKASIPVGGRIMEASGDERTVVATMSGVVRFASPITEGSLINSGKALLSLSAGHIQGGSPAETALASYKAAEAEYIRAKELVKDKIISEKEFNSIKATYETAKIAYKATPANRQGGTTVTAPIGGYIKNCSVKDGDYVSAGQPLLTITQNRRLYLKADVPERYYKELPQVASAKFKTSCSDNVYDISVLGGKLVATGRSSSDTPGYVTVTFAFDNRGDFLPGSFAEVWLLTNNKDNALTLPVSAITEEQGAFFVYVQDDPTCYVKRSVKLGMTDGERVEILSGVSQKERVVTRGAVNVKVAGASGTIPAHTHNH